MIDPYLVQALSLSAGETAAAVEADPPREEPEAEKGHAVLHPVDPAL